ncbi:MAG: transporter [Methylobacter sp.]|nr:MAG: transporter [Methylobacter sp.]PPD23931.1 MAG: transporter [Methylobacter sp.]
MKYPKQVLTTAFLSLVLLTVSGCASGPKQEGTGEYVDDTIVSTRVRAQLLNEPGLSSNEINVETFKGTVQLSGFVKQQQDMTRAIAIARTTPGVKSVKNDMRLK